MTEQLATDDGQAVPIDTTDTEFAAAMAAPAAAELAAPPRLDPPDPEAPYGRTAAGKAKKGPGGRPPRPDKARTTDKPAAGSTGPAKADYAEGLGETLDGTAIALTMAPSAMLKAQAAIVRRNRANTVTALNLAAQNNSYARRVIAPLASGQVSWYILAAMALAPPVMQSLALWRGGDGLAQLGLGTVAELAAEADAALAAELAKLGMAEAPAPAPAGPPAAPGALYGNPVSSPAGIPGRVLQLPAGRACVIYRADAGR